MDDSGTVFETYADWLPWWLGRPETGAVRFLCIDAAGRLCSKPADFQRARAEGTFPVRLTVPDEISTGLSEVRLALGQARERIAALEDACGLAAGALDLLDALEAQVERMVRGDPVGQAVPALGVIP